jgi:L-aspartate oxidase
MARVHADADLAPRDVVARAIAQEMEGTGAPVYLTLAHLDATYVRKRFPTITDVCARVGLDLARDRIPVGPAAHYFMGGVDTDLRGRTSLPGLFAAGEVACTGVHGANRLASNSLLEGLVFGARAAEAMQEPPAAAPLKSDRVPAGASELPAPSAQPRASSSQSRAPAEDVRDLMWRSVGLFRTREGLQGAVASLDRAYLEQRERLHGSEGDANLWRQANLVTAARLVAHAALRREESRGAHFRLDFPARDDERWKVHVVE